MTDAPRSVNELNMITGRTDGSMRSRFSVSKPSKLGISTSRSTTSGFRHVESIQRDLTIRGRARPAPTPGRPPAPTPRRAERRRNHPRSARESLTGRFRSDLVVTGCSVRAAFAPRRTAPGIEAVASASCVCMASRCTRWLPRPAPSPPRRFRLAANHHDPETAELRIGPDGSGRIPGRPFPACSS